MFQRVDKLCDEQNKSMPTAHLPTAPGESLSRGATDTAAAERWSQKASNAFHRQSVGLLNDGWSIAVYKAVYKPALYHAAWQNLRGPFRP